MEVVLVAGGPALRDALETHLEPEHVAATPDGWMAVWRPRVDPKSSISRILESHGLMWQQPLRVENGWEHYDAIAFEDEQAALDALRKDHPTQVTRRTPIDVDAIRSNLFMALGPVLEAPTDKQAEALAVAHALGYYRSPRAVRTQDVAEALQITRSSLEERLRGGENRIMEHIGPALRSLRNL